MSARTVAPALARALPLVHGGPSGPVKTHCPYCAFQCGMTVTKPGIDAELKVQADEDFPVNRGQMCIKGFTSAALLDHAQRLQSPLLRGADGKLAPASWNEALDFIAQRIST
ncbi:MAG TPA: molybdopterin-dependent oxidoreductase, partial [Polyangiaceae bacterium]